MIDRTKVIFEGTPEHRITKIRKDIWGGIVPQPPGYVQKYKIKKIYSQGNYIVIEDKLLV